MIIPVPSSSPACSPSVEVMSTTPGSTLLAISATLRSPDRFEKVPVGLLLLVKPALDEPLWSSAIPTATPPPPKAMTPAITSAATASGRRFFLVAAMAGPLADGIAANDGSEVGVPS